MISFRVFDRIGFAHWGFFGTPPPDQVEPPPHVIDAMTPGKFGIRTVVICENTPEYKIIEIVRSSS